MGQRKNFSEHSDLEEYKKTADITQRRKQARRMRLLSKQSGFKMKKKRTLMKVRDTAKITKSARKQTIKMFRKKAYPNYDDMSISAKVKADQVVMQRFGKKIDKKTFSSSHPMHVYTYSSKDVLVLPAGTYNVKINKKSRFFFF